MSGCENEKRLKKSDSFKEEDQVSNLPEPVLCRILSLLSMKDAVKTSLLGPKWKDLWAAVPNLEFDFKSMYHPNGPCCDSKDKLSKFMDFVEGGLILRDGLNIQKFNLSCFEICDFSQIYAWICNVITCNVQEIDIRLSVHPYGQLPWRLLTCKTLGVLKLTGRFVLNVPANICFPSLKILHLRSLIYTDDASIEKLFSSCPILEDLDVVRHDWDNVWSFNVSVQSLRRLSLCFHPKGFEFLKDHQHKIMVDTPNLEYLKLHNYVSEDYMFYNISCLVEADLDIIRPRVSSVRRSIFSKGVGKLFMRMSTVKLLSLSTRTLCVLLFVHDLRYNNIPTFHNLVRLKLGLDPFLGWHLLPKLLVSSPNLEVLCFEQGLVYVKNNNPNDHHIRFRSMPQEVPECLLTHLKTIEIHRLVGKIDELKLIKYFLKNAMVLKNMTIRCHCMNVVWNVRDRLLMFHDEIWKCPWGSSSCQVKFII
ncbi:hypothetical protein ACSBR1_011698 [Camellia fascicularis]